MFRTLQPAIALDRIAVGSEFAIVWSHYGWALYSIAFSPDTNLYPATPVSERAATIEGPFTMLATDGWEEDFVLDFVHLNAVEPTHLAAEASLDDDASGEDWTTELSLEVGQIGHLRAYPMGPDGWLAGVFDYTWSSSDPSIAKTHNYYCTIEALAEGETTVSVTNGRHSGELRVTVAGASR